MRSSLHLQGSTPILKEQHTKLATLWQSLQDHNDSLFFRTPVDLKAFSDYSLYVKEPMDLSTIQRKLREQKYRSVQEMLDDIQLIWDNCRRYNPAGTWIYNISINMDRAFRKMVHSYLPQIHLDRPSKPVRAESVVDEDDVFPWEEVSFQEKNALVERMKVLTPYSMKALTEFIVEVAPKAFVEESGKARILIDNIDALAFPTIQEKLQELILTNRPSTKKMKAY